MPEWLQNVADFVLPGNAFHACVAVGPLTIYLLLIGAINLARRPLLVSGTRDAAALGLALSGLLLVGPVDLFFPDAITMHVILLVRLLLLGFYVMCLVLVLLLLRPRLVIYNISVDQLRPVLADLVDKLDRDARWAGDSLVLPALGVQLHLDSFPPMRNVSLAAIGASRTTSAGGNWRSRCGPRWARWKACATGPAPRSCWASERCWSPGWSAASPTILRPWRRVCSRP